MHATAHNHVTTPVSQDCVQTQTALRPRSGVIVATRFGRLRRQRGEGGGGGGEQKESQRW